MPSTILERLEESKGRPRTTWRGTEPPSLRDALTDAIRLEVGSLRQELRASLASGLSAIKEDMKLAIEEMGAAVQMRALSAIEDRQPITKLIGTPRGRAATYTKKRFGPVVVKEYMRVVWDAYNGLCPCCGTARIMKDENTINDFFVVDHWFRQHEAFLRTGWAVCKGCNNAGGVLGPGGSFKREPLRWKFAEFHKHVDTGSRNYSHRDLLGPDYVLKGVSPTRNIYISGHGHGNIYEIPSEEAVA